MRLQPGHFLPGNLEGGGGGKEIINARLLLSVSLFLRAKGRKKKDYGKQRGLSLSSSTSFR
jgi:hypothetical protein